MVDFQREPLNTYIQAHLLPTLPLSPITSSLEEIFLSLIHNQRYGQGNADLWFFFLSCPEDLLVILRTSDREFLKMVCAPTTGEQVQPSTLYRPTLHTH